MNRMGSGDGDGFVAGMAIGALVGAAVALIFAPKAGVAFRAEIGESAAALRDAVAERYQQLAARAGVTLEDVRERAGQAADDLEHGAQDLIAVAARQGQKATGRL